MRLKCLSCMSQSLCVAIPEQVINDYEQVGEMLEDSSDQPENIYENITDEPTYENIYEKVTQSSAWCIVFQSYSFVTYNCPKINYSKTLRNHLNQVVSELEKMLC